MRETLSLDLVEIRRAGELLAGWGHDGGELPRFEIASGDEVFGEIGVEGSLGEDEESFLRAIANVLATALGRLRGEERMRHEALHDPLTGLANRALCRERLIHALARTGRDQGGACVLFIDLDDFKAVNDLYGHAAGDALLIALAPPARGHGPPGGHRGAAGRGRVRDRVRGHRRAHGDRARRTAWRRRSTSRWTWTGSSTGCRRRSGSRWAARAGATRTRCSPTPTPPAYRAKAEGRGRVEVFDTRLRQHARERLRTAAALERALSLGQLRLAFQPIVALADRSVIGHEALLRWDSPGRRDERAGGLHPGRGGVGADRGDRGVDADAGLPRERGGVRARRGRARRSG